MWSARACFARPFRDLRLPVDNVIYQSNPANKGVLKRGIYLGHQLHKVCEFRHSE